MRAARLDQVAREPPDQGQLGAGMLLDRRGAGEPQDMTGRIRATCVLVSPAGAEERYAALTRPADRRDRRGAVGVGVAGTDHRAWHRRAVEGSRARSAVASHTGSTGRSTARLACASTSGIARCALTASSRSPIRPMRMLDIGYIRNTPKRVSGIRCVERGGQRERERGAGLGGIEDAVVPRAAPSSSRDCPPRSYVSRIGLLERLFLGRAHRLAGRLELGLLHLREHRGRLLAAHHADAAVGPHEQEARLVGAAAHAVVPGAEAAADDDA